MRKNRLVCIFFIILAAICFFPCALFADTARERLESSRSMNAAEAIVLLEANLGSSGVLRPYYLADLVRRYGETGNWKKALDRVSILESGTVPPELADQVAWWHTLALENNGQKARAADLAYRKIDSNPGTDPSVYLAWFRNSSSGAEAMIAKLDRAYPLLKHTDQKTFALSRYLSGLCAVREGAWAFAELSFSRFSPAHDADFPDLVPWSRYYRAYSLYRLGKWNDALDGFTDYLDTWKNHAFGWNAATAAALSAMQAGADALPFAERAIKLAPTAADRAESSMLRASILFDRKRYADAEPGLAGIADGSATNGLTPSAPRALFMLAEISVRLRKSDEAESRWLSLVSRFPKEPIAEDALYRAGELRYLDGNWARASELFTRYRQRWISGRLLDTVLRSGGDSLKRNGKTDLAILWWEDLVKKYPDSPAVPRTLFDLVDTYREKGEYANAIRVAENYRAKYPEEARMDGIDRDLAELRLLAKGGNSGTASLEADWIKANRAETADGRTAGVSLARRYLADYSRRSEAKSILREITAKAPANPDKLPAAERSVYASAWSLYGAACREDADFKTASRALLAAGNFYAPIDGERSAETLYGAVDSFLQAGLRADAEKTAETLESTWPGSVWTNRAKILMER